MYALPQPGNTDSQLIAELRCHPDQACPFVQSLQARATFLDAGTLALGFTLLGDLEQLLLPPPSSSVRTDELWKHTCFEAFFARAGDASYHEVNLSPSTAWATYSFRRYREGGLPAPSLDLRMVVHHQPKRLEVHALLGLDRTVILTPGQHLRIGLAAVIEQKDGRLSYWAVRHPEGQPDFHQSVTFALELAPMPEED